MISALLILVLKITDIRQGVTVRDNVQDEIAVFINSEYDRKTYVSAVFPVRRCSIKIPKLS